MPDLPSRAGPVSPGTFTPRQAYLAAVWGGGVFGQVTGDRVYLLVDDRRGTEVVAPDGKVVVTTTRTFQAIFADGPAGTKWLVTGAMPRQGRALAWCLEVTAEIGKMVEVALSLDNALDLEEESRPMPET